MATVREPTTASTPLRPRRNLLRALGALFVTTATALFPVRSRSSDPPLVFGVVPYLSARKLAQLYEPIRAWFAATLAQPVTLESAPDYRAHFARTAGGEYDFIATSPYFGRIAQQRHGMVGLARPSTPLEPLLIVLPQSPIRTLSDLKGRKIATSDPWANLTLAARRLFREQGWVIGRDLYLEPTGSHANSFAHLQQGLADAAVVSVTAITQLNLAADRYRILYRFPPSPPLLYLAHRRLGESRLAQLRRALLAWSAQEGQAVFARLGHGTLQPITDADWDALDPFVADFDQLVAGGHA